MSRKLKNLDIFKGIAILLLVAFHISGQVFNGEPQWFRRSSYQGVNAFFLASGLGLTYSLIIKNNMGTTLRFWPSWFKRRFLRIFPLYWFVMVVTFFVYVFNLNFLRLSYGTGSVPTDFILHLFLLHIFIGSAYFSINVAWWFVAIIAYFYLFFPIVFTFLYRFRSRTLVFVFVLALALTAHYILPIRKQITISLLFFIMGICFAFWIDKIRRRKILQSLHIRSILLGVSFLFSVGGIIITGNSLLHPRSVLSLPYDLNYLLFSFFCVAALYALSMAIVLFNKLSPVEYFGKVMTWCGVNSYAIFLIHWGLIFPIFSKFHNRFIGAIVYSIVLIVVSYTLTRLSLIDLTRIFRRA